MFRPFQTDQPFLLPVNIDEWLDPDSLAYFICDVVDKLDLSQICARYEVEMRGAPPFHPVMMVRILMYGYCLGITSSRKLEYHVKDSIGFRVLTAGDTPGCRAIAEFRRRHLDILQGLFEQVMDIWDRAGLVTLEHVAVDSTKMKANASKHKPKGFFDAVEALCQQLGEGLDAASPGDRPRTSRTPSWMSWRVSRFGAGAQTN